MGDLSCLLLLQVESSIPIGFVWPVKYHIPHIGAVGWFHEDFKMKKMARLNRDDYC